MADVELNLDDVTEKEKMNFGINVEGMTEPEKKRLAKKVGAKLTQGDEPVPVASGGPHGLGDPEDYRMRKAEYDVLLPKMMKTKAEKMCAMYGRAFARCSAKAGVGVTWKCKEENKALKGCIESLMLDQKFWDESTREYLELRKVYRLTGQTVYERRLHAMKEILAERKAQGKKVLDLSEFSDVKFDL